MPYKVDLGYLGKLQRLLVEHLLRYESVELGHIKLGEVIASAAGF